MSASINNHEGKKYLRNIRSATTGVGTLDIDVYSVLEAFGVTCPATAHALKKLLTAGQRGKGSRMDDLKGAQAAISRAIELQSGRELLPEESEKK